MGYGKTIKLFLIDGEPNGRMSCELSNWTGKAYKIPRTKVKDSTDRIDLNNPGIYLLFGKAEDGNDLIYVGEAESVFKRLAQHLSQKDFWNETICFISKDENLNKAHIKYLENRLYEIAKSVNRYKVENSTIPTMPSIAESDKAEMEEFLQNIRMLVNTLGHKVFDEKRGITSKKSQRSCFIKAARGANAEGQTTADGFVVFKGSKVAITTVPSMTPNFLSLRSKLIETGALIQDGDDLVFSDDYIFSSASTAASMVMGRNANGLTEWKMKDGRTIKDLESEISIN